MLLLASFDLLQLQLSYRSRLKNCQINLVSRGYLWYKFKVLIIEIVIPPNYELIKLGILYNSCVHQVQSRLVVLWLVLDPVKEVQADSNVPMMICAWCVAEIVRLVRSLQTYIFWLRFFASQVDHISMPSSGQINDLFIIFRYWYYALSLVDKVPYFLTWARYSFFTFLYPIGVSGELLTIYRLLKTNNVVI